MQDSNKARPTRAKSIRRGAYALFLKSLKVVIPALVGLYAWAYLPPILFPMLKGPNPDRKPKTFAESVMEAKQRVAERERRDREYARLAHRGYRTSSENEPKPVKE